MVTLLIPGVSTAVAKLSVFYSFTPHKWPTDVAQKGAKCDLSLMVSADT